MSKDDSAHPKVDAILLTIDNFRHIEIAYGEGTANQIAQSIGLQAASWLRGEWRVGETAYGRVYLKPENTADHVSSLGASAIASQLAQVLSEKPVKVAEFKVWAAVSADVLCQGRSVCAAEAQLDRQSCFTGYPARADLGWAKGYRNDMSNSIHLMELMGSRGSGPIWQPVISGNDIDTLYYRLRYGDDKIADRACLDRTGLASVSDIQMFERAIKALDASGYDSIGVEVSGASAFVDRRWKSIFEQLRSKRDIARRLVVELDFSISGGRLAEAAAFAGEMRRLGCTIGIAGFGIGVDFVQNSLALHPQIIRLDSSLTRRVLLGGSSAELFAQSTAIARNLAPIVVADGIDSLELATAAKSCGIEWISGAFAGQVRRIRAKVA